MLDKIFYNVFTFGTIISICILPIIIFLSKYKYKYKSKNVYKILTVILFLFILPLNVLQISSVKDYFHEKTEINNFDDFHTKVVIENPNMIIEFDENINIKNNNLLTFSQIVPYIWFLGLSGIFIYNIVVYNVFLNNEKKNYTFEKNEKADNIITTMCNKMNTKNVSYIISKNTSTPKAVGIFNKRIILSKEVLDKDECEMILKHELIHVKNKDIEYKFLLLLFKCIYWFNPIIYFLANQIDEVLELRCDEIVLENTNQEYRIEYAKALLNQIEENRNKQYKFSMTFASKRRNIMKRFSNIVEETKKKSVIGISCLVSLVIIASICLIIFVPNVNFATIQENIVENMIDTNNNIIEENVTEPSLNENFVEQSGENLVSENTSKEVPDSKLIEEDPFEIITLEEIEEETKLVKNEKTETVQFIYPVKKVEITSRFGKRNTGVHTGIDIVGATGDSIYASAGGEVVYSGYKGSYGYLVVINHGNNFQTYYAQNSKNLVKVGDVVNQGDIIAEVGSTGNSTGPHIHFEIRENGTPVSPMDYLKK